MTWLYLERISLFIAGLTLLNEEGAVRVKSDGSSNQMKSTKEKSSMKLEKN